MTNSDSDWRYDLDEVDEDGIVEPEQEELRPGSPSAENALFVALGVLTTLAVVGRVVLLA